MNGVSLWLMTLVVLMDYGMSHVEKKVDLEAMTGDEIAAMAIESRKSNPQESFGSTLNYSLGGGGPGPFEGMDIPDEVRKEIEKAVKDAMKTILEKAKTSKSLRKVVREELKGHAAKDAIDLKEIFGDFGWDVNAEEEDDTEPDTTDDFDDTSDFEEEFDGKMEKIEDNIQQDNKMKDEL